MNPKNTLRTLALLAAMLLAASAASAASNSDDFNDNRRDPRKWGTDSTVGNGVLTERNQRLEYTCKRPSIGGEDLSVRPWNLTRFPCNADWEIRLDVVNLTVPNPPFQVNSMGFDIISVRDPNDNIFTELYASALGAASTNRNGFVADVDTDDVDVASEDSEGFDGVTNAALRVVFTAATKVITFYYDTNRADGYQWEQLAEFGLGGSGGATTNTDWQLTADDQIAVYIYGYSSAMPVPSGMMFADNFSEVGGVPPSGAPSPDPIGNYRFRFPSNNLLLTRILSLTGNYQGNSVMFSNRAYNIDVAQDESGKITAMGTVDGILNEDGAPELSDSFGALTTENGQPTMRYKQNFAGTIDGTPVTLAASGTAPLTPVDIGGTNSIAGTVSVRGRAGGVPFSARNVRMSGPVPPGASNNVKHVWEIQLDLSRKVIKGKERTVGTCELLLPNGDTIAYRERVVKYSATKGYNLSFKRGTNTTVNPARVDKKTTILIRNLLFQKQGDTWEPTAGTIQYQFFGQKGSANLLDFERP